MLKSLSLAALMLGMTSITTNAATGYTPGGTPTDLAGQGLVGFNFTVTTSISVTDLGFYGVSLGGGDTPWSAIFNLDTSTQLASVDWAAGTATAGWNYKSLSMPITLAPGTTYQVVGTAYWSPNYSDTSLFTYGSEVSAIGFTSNGGWDGWGAPRLSALPATDSSPNVVANFQYTPVAVPEPSTYAVAIGLGCIGLVILRRRKIAQTA